MKATVPLQAEGEGELPALEIQAEAEIEPASVSTQVIAEVSVAEGSLFTLDSSVVPDSSVGMEIVEPELTLKQQKRMKRMIHRYDDESSSSGTDKHAVESGGEKTKEAADTRVVISRQKTTLEEIMKLTGGATSQLFQFFYSGYIGTRNKKGVQQPQVQSSAQVEVFAL